MNLRRLKKFLIITTICLVVVAVTTAVYLAKPLPPPQVSIEFQSFNPDKTKVFHLKPDTNDNNQLFFDSVGQNDWWFRAFPSFQNFEAEQTNVYCTLYLTNRGSTRIWWISMDCRVEARTPQGWVTNVFSHFTTIPWSVSSSKIDSFSVYVPAGAIEWRVTGQYEYYKHHNMRVEYFGWLVDDLKLGQAGKLPPKIIVYPLVGIGWLFALLPEPKEELGEIHSEYFTNRPPMLLSVMPTKS